MGSVSFIPHLGRSRFVVVGAHALAVHGVPRATQDLYVWIEATPENAKLVWEALVQFGAPLEDLEIDPADFVRPATVIQIGLPPNRIDVLTELTGIEDFEAAWNARVESQIAGRDIPFLGRAALIANKRATGRLKDLADIEALGEDV
ncbi:MAG: hypothetical protein HKN72_08310 [Gemmatimonadetes bacterium]|nr:hypothetical protein [Gemmatimonadota bacterium]